MSAGLLASMNLYQIALYPFNLSVRGDYPQVERALRLVLRGFQVPSTPFAPASAPNSPVIETPVGAIHCGAGRLEVELNGQTHDPLTVVDHVEPEIVNQAVRESVGLLWIHGACLMRDEDCILLVGDTGTGKTTLSLGLVSRGFRLLTDDIILIDLSRRQIIPMPRCPKIRPPAPDALRAAGFDLTREAQMIGRYAMLPPERFFTQPASMPIRRVILIQRSPEAPGSVHELNLTSGVLALLSRSNILGIDPDLTAVHTFFKDTIFTRMTLGAFSADLHTIVQLLKNPI